MNEYQYMSKIKELEKQNQELREQLYAAPSLPAMRMMSGESAKATFYATKSSLALFNSVVNKVSEEYGFKKYLAAAFVLEESLKCFSGLFTKDGE